MAGKPSAQMEFLLQRAQSTPRTQPPEKAGEAITAIQVWQTVWELHKKIGEKMQGMPENIQSALAERDTFEFYWGTADIKQFDLAATTTTFKQADTPAKAEAEITLTPSIEQRLTPALSDKLPPESHHPLSTHGNHDISSVSPQQSHHSRHRSSVALSTSTPTIPRAARKALPPDAIYFISSSAPEAICGPGGCYVWPVRVKFPLLSITWEILRTQDRRGTLALWFPQKWGRSYTPSEQASYQVQHKAARRGFRAWQKLEDHNSRLPDISRFFKDNERLFEWEKSGNHDDMMSKAPERDRKDRHSVQDNAKDRTADRIRGHADKNESRPDLFDVDELLEAEKSKLRSKSRGRVIDDPWSDAARKADHSRSRSPKTSDKKSYRDRK